jgi:menaquinol-cytochrome c reductase cytochrome b/c subunit
MMEKSKIESGFVSDAKKEPRRIVFITRNTSAKVKDEREPRLMTYPHLLVREAIVFVALFWDAPLEQLANPLLTPNPAKAPWYFLGLQELLHFFPPFVAGILLPTLVVIALIEIPYFNVNVEGKPLWSGHASRRFGIAVGAVIIVLALLAIMDAWTIIAHAACGRAAGGVLFVQRHDWRHGAIARQATVLVGDDLVHRDGPLPDRGWNLFPRPWLVLGMALGDTCQLKTWAGCRADYG